MRYLIVFSRKGWQVIDVANSCEVIAKGSLEEMKEEMNRLNSGNAACS